jgi:hypothetical protein
MLVKLSFAYYGVKLTCPHWGTEPEPEGGVELLPGGEEAEVEVGTGGSEAVTGPEEQGEPVNKMFFAS